MPVTPFKSRSKAAAVSGNRQNRNPTRDARPLDHDFARKSPQARLSARAAADALFSKGQAKIRFKGNLANRLRFIFMVATTWTSSFHCARPAKELEHVHRQHHSNNSDYCPAWRIQRIGGGPFYGWAITRRRPRPRRARAPCVGPPWKALTSSRARKYARAQVGSSGVVRRILTRDPSSIDDK